jgi:hypothetical protein
MVVNATAAERETAARSAALGDADLLTRARERRLWHLAIALLLALTLWPIWQARFPPLQDYPGQLFFADVLRTHGDPASDYDRYYEFAFHPVYATFYVAVLAFGALVPIEIAGKLALSLYPVLVAIAALVAGRRAAARPGSHLCSRGPAWGALLFFPLAFHQQYYFGNLNYFLALPLLVLAELDVERMLERTLTRSSVLRQVAWQVALIVTHPLCLLVHAAGAAIIGVASRPRAWREIGAVLGIAALLLGAMYAAERGTRLASVSQTAGTAWLPPLETLRFFGLMFTGMLPLRDAQPVTVVLWIAIVAVIATSLFGRRQERAWSSLSRPRCILLAIATLAMFATPFRRGDYSYLNVRLAAWVYFLIALCATEIPFRAWSGAAITALSAACLVSSAAMQARISRETEDIVPIARAMLPHARFLPLVFEAASPELDPFWFAPHVQEYNYYHVISGGGFNPYLFGSPVDPVRQKSGAERPAPGVAQPDAFTWEQYGADYDYILVRGSREGLAEYLGLHAVQVVASGKWTLFARRGR